MSKQAEGEVRFRRFGPMFESSSTLYLGEEGAYPIPTIEFKTRKGAIK